MSKSLTVALFATAFWFAASCDSNDGTAPEDSNPEVPPGASITVALTTTGKNLDPDGYLVALDASPSTRHVDANGTLRLTGIGPGIHQITVTGLAKNCRLPATNAFGFSDEAFETSRQVEIVSQAAAIQEEFQVFCYSTATLVIRTTTTGPNQPSLLIGVLTHDPRWLWDLSPNGELEIPFVTPRSHEFGVSGCGVQQRHAVS